MAKTTIDKSSKRAISICYCILALLKQICEINGTQTTLYTSNSIQKILISMIHTITICIDKDNMP